MAGEMSWEDIKDYPDMIALAKKIQSAVKIAAEVRPFDQYQGPFIAVNFDHAPLRKSRGYSKNNRLTSWNAKVWYDMASISNDFVLEYRHHFSTGTAKAVVKMIKKIKAERK
jgi:hypothetical protein